MAREPKKVEPSEQSLWPERINLLELVPADHPRAGEPRYRLTNNGRGRIDILRYKEVPQELVDAAVASQFVGI